MESLKRMTTYYPELQRAVTALATVCDGAQTKDDYGFNATDSHFGKKLATLSSWTPRQSRAAWRMIRKYRGQLSHYGIDYDAIPEPAIPTDEPQPARQILSIPDGFEIRFAYDPGLVSAVKTIRGARFDRAEKVWHIRDTSALTCRSILDFAVSHDFDINDAAYHTIEQAVQDAERLAEMSRAEASDFQVAGLGGTLRPFQAAGVRYAVQAKRCIIGDEMGLGKTVQGIATLHTLNAFPALIICPASLKLNWMKEVRHWLPDRTIMVVDGRVKAGSPDVLIINYDLLQKNLMALKLVKWQGIIFDEAHYLKNYKAKRTEAAKDLAASIPVRLQLTGTPVLNRPQELISPLTILGRLEEFGGWYKFATRYCQGYKGRFGWDLSGAAHLDELNARLRESCYIRRQKKDVLKELPAKQRSIVPVELSNRDEYARVEADVLHWIGQRAAENAEFQDSIALLPEDEQQRAKEQRRETAAERAKQAEQLVRIEALKQVAAQGKIDAVKDWVETFLESGEKLVLFAHHREIVKMLAETFKAPCITGETPVVDRQAYVERFQTDPECRLIVLNLRAGGVGLTLTAASNVAFVELGWTPGDMDQAEDRVHRIGQTDSVMAWYLLAEGTIDSDIYALIEEKRKVVDAVTDGGNVQTGKSILNELMDRLQNRKRGITPVRVVRDGVLDFDAVTN